ncbi:hypothetical protein QLX67_10240 [Balneolaceae bacterium ANBcel3]|nr:hypothetical protein [Balneolaceae bacterium ANBcel3]
MGAAAFHNEMINQVAEAYLGYRQKELKRRVKPDQYREELQKVKAYIAANNVYGMDINPTAIELGKLSLWLNGIHRDMETPFFANRLAVGNAVVGAWLKAYKEHEISLEKDNRGKEIKKEWWEKGPKPLKFGKKGILRRENEIYHFLLPDKNMLASAGIKMLKDEHEKEVKKARSSLKDFYKPFRKEELNKLKQISDRIDAELENYYRFIKQLNAQTHSRYNIFGALEEGEQQGMKLRSYDEKEKLAQQRLRHDAAYYKLKLVMDYWCALWFWDVRDARHLPSRNEYLDELLKILAVNPDENQPKGFTVQQKLLHHQGTQLTFDDRVEETARQTGAIIEQVDLSTFFDENERLKIVQWLSTRYKFFHPQLEFLEVFYERGGFDLICGNPPWVKLKFEPSTVIAEYFPEVTLKERSSLKNQTDIKKYFDKNSLCKKVYFHEQIEVVTTTNFVTSYQNYPSLQGQQSNLYKAIIVNGLDLLGGDGYLGLVHPETIFDDPKAGHLRRMIYPKLKYHFQFRNSLYLFSEIKDQKMYGVNIYVGTEGKIDFVSINNLFHPQTVDASFLTPLNSEVPAFQKYNYATGRLEWDLRGHQKRILNFNKHILQIATGIVSNQLNFKESGLLKLHVNDSIKVLESVAQVDQKLADKDLFITECWHETNDVGKHIEKVIKEPPHSKFDMVYCGPNLFTSTTHYKNTRSTGRGKADYDVIDLEQFEFEEDMRTRFVTTDNAKRMLTEKKYGKEWGLSYRLAFRKMLNQTADRTLNGGIIPPGTSHTNGVISIQFPDNTQLLSTYAFTNTIIADFIIRTTNSNNLTDSRIKVLPYLDMREYEEEIVNRALLLSCIGKLFVELWEDQIDRTGIQLEWAKKDPRLEAIPFQKELVRQKVLRSPYERRQALLELDVIYCQKIGIELESLISLYRTEFSKFLDYDSGTYYDKKGRIVFSPNHVGLSGVGVSAQELHDIKDFKDGETYVHTIDSAKNELYGGQQVTYYAPFDKCDRVEDYKVAWRHFEEVFGE